MMKHAIRIPSVVLTCLCASTVLVQAQTPETPRGDLPYEVRTAEVRNASLRYLDFGGEGLPVVFTPAMSRPVEEYVEIATRLSNDYRVLVVGRRDEGGPIQWIGTRAHAEDLLGFLDALGIERAVLAGNTDPSYRMTYLAEEHPERVAGVIYLAGPPALDDFAGDRASGWPMLLRMWGMSDGYADEPTHTFRYRRDEAANIAVPALTFTKADGTRGVDNFAFPLAFVGSPRVAEAVAEMAKTMGDQDPDVRYFARLQEDTAFRDQRLAEIQDPEARAYFQRLVVDAAMQDEIERYWLEGILPAERANWTAFRRAFGQNLRVVELDVPAISGYEYKTAPDLIEIHIRRFLNDIGVRRGSRR
jgi:pimeloyl-ACP methyl ester carboxylesterase